MVLRQLIRELQKDFQIQLSEQQGLTPHRVRQENSFLVFVQQLHKIFANVLTNLTLLSHSCLILYSRFSFFLNKESKACIKCFLLSQCHLSVSTPLSFHFILSSFAYEDFFHVPMFFPSTFLPCYQDPICGYGRPYKLNMH